MNRNISLDILKLLMSFMVVGLHAGFLDDVDLLGEYLTVNGVFRLAVPTFLVINGFYFFSVLSEDKQSIWIKRVLVLYVFWMVLYSCFWLPPNFSSVEMVKMGRTIIFGYYHLWYMSGMIGAAMILIFLRRYSSFVLLASIVFAFIAGVFIQYAGNYHLYFGSVFDKIFNYNWIHRNFLLFSYPFFCLGYLINKHSWCELVSLKLAAVLAVLGFIALIGESYFNYCQENIDSGFDNLISLILVCPAVFVFCLKIKLFGEQKNISAYSSAIYFVHVFALIFFQSYTDFRGTALTVVAIITSALVSFLVIKVNGRFKFIL